MNSVRIHCSQKTGQKLWLLFMYRTWTVTTCGKTREKKKMQKHDVAKRNAYPNITLVPTSL